MSASDIGPRPVRATLFRDQHATTVDGKDMLLEDPNTRRVAGCH